MTVSSIQSLFTNHTMAIFCLITECYAHIGCWHYWPCIKQSIGPVRPNEFNVVVPIVIRYKNPTSQYGSTTTTHSYHQQKMQRFTILSIHFLFPDKNNYLIECASCEKKQQTRLVCQNIDVSGSTHCASSSIMLIIPNLRKSLLLTL